MNIFAISALINMVTSGVIGSLVLAHNPYSKRDILFSLFGYAVSLWSLAYFFWQTADSSSNAFFLIKIVMAIASFIPFFYFHFITVFLDEERRFRNIIYLGYLFAVIFSWMCFNPEVITGVATKLSFPYWPTIGRLYPLLLGGWLLFVCYGSFLLYSRFRVAKGEYRSQLAFIFWGMIIGYLGGVTNYLLWFDIPVPPIGNILVSFYVVMVGIAVVKHQLFNIKVIATEFFVLVLCIIFVSNIFTSNTLTERFVNIFVFTATLVFGVLLVRGVKKEIKQREEIRKLADELAGTNVQLEVSNERLRILDQRKSEFVSIASHQLRTPVTAMKGYASLLLEDSYGALPEKMKDPIQKIFHSSDRLALMINDFLNVSKIEQGSMTYTFVPLDLKKMVIDLVQDFHVAAGKKKLDVETEIPDVEKFNVVADEGKIRQILSNLIDNAIKYTPQGSVRVILKKEPAHGERGMILLQIKDTGIGLSQDDIHHLFGKFTRGAEGSKVNTTGSGLGLYVAKKMMEEHKGNIWVDSEGKGKGSVFCIELPEFHNELPEKT